MEEIDLDQENVLKKSWLRRTFEMRSKMFSKTKSFKNNQRLDEIKAILKEVLYNSFSQAILKIILTPHILLKIFLLVFVLASTSLASILVIGSFMEYFAYKVSTTSRIIYENPTLFPKVTFCNVNWFTTEYAYNLTQMGVEWSEIMSLSIDEKKQLGHSLENILIQCKYNNIPCDSTDFTWSFDPDYGNCYTFNSGFNSNKSKIDLKKSSLVGWNFGLQLTLYLNVYEKLLNDKNNVGGLGALIRLGNSSYLTDYLDSGILVTPGLQTNIEMSREFRSILPKPYSNCEIDSNSPLFQPGWDLYNLVSQSEYVYSQQLCFSQCLQKYFIEKYNCTLYYFVSLYNVSLCDLNVYTSNLFLDNIFNNNFINNLCLPSCPLECNQTLFKSSISSYQLIGEQFKANILNNSNLVSDFIYRQLDSTQAEKSIVDVNIFYSSLSFILTTESPQVDWISLLGSIGGNLGLFLGVSVFSLFEMVEAAIEIYFIFKKSKQIEPN